MTASQKNTLRRFYRAAKKAGATHTQKSSHGCGKYSAQAFGPKGLLLDWNL